MVDAENGGVDGVRASLSSLEAGGSMSSDKVLPLVYEELRRLASSKLRNEPKNLTLQTTSLVHEAYARLVDAEEPPKWDSTGHFFVAAAESMRRILIEQARRRGTLKAGGNHRRVQIDLDSLSGELRDEHLVALDDALQLLEQEDARMAGIVKLRFFAGLTMPQVAAALDISLSTTERDWAYARAWLFRQMKKDLT